MSSPATPVAEVARPIKLDWTDAELSVIWFWRHGSKIESIPYFVQHCEKGSVLMEVSEIENLIADWKARCNQLCHRKSKTKYAEDSRQTCEGFKINVVRGQNAATRSKGSVLHKRTAKTVVRFRTKVQSDGTATPTKSRGASDLTDTHRSLPPKPPLLPRDAALQTSPPDPQHSSHASSNSFRIDRGNTNVPSLPSTPSKTNNPHSLIHESLQYNTPPDSGTRNGDYLENGMVPNTRNATSDVGILPTSSYPHDLIYPSTEPQFGDGCVVPPGTGINSSFFNPYPASQFSQAHYAEQYGPLGGMQQVFEADPRSVFVPNHQIYTDAQHPQRQTPTDYGHLTMSTLAHSTVPTYPYFPGNNMVTAPNQSQVNGMG